MMKGATAAGFDGETFAQDVRTCWAGVVNHAARFARIRTLSYTPGRPALSLHDALVTPEEYLAGELLSPNKHEYLGGVVHAMAGAKNNCIGIELPLAEIYERTNFPPLEVVE